ncbi:MAG TPA: fimbria/pilus periplasmic chaperone [Verrucomicrobiota bacterium]|nr:fimbria/pilus periplasmic chaperone [Verrucomicrobiota bacterium]
MNGQTHGIARGTLQRATHWLAIALTLLACVPVCGFTLVPMVQNFAPSGRKANQAFQVENESGQTVAIQISMKTRTISADGRESNEDAEDDFIVYPAQLILKPREAQTVRVKWIGNPKPDRELAYRIVAEQLPVNVSKEQEAGINIKIMTRYLGSVYIVPNGAKPAVALDLAQPQRNAGGREELLVQLGNHGTKHAMLRDLRLRIQSQGRTVELGPESLKGLAGENLLAGGQRKIALPWPEGIPFGPVEVTFRFAQGKN